MHRTNQPSKAIADPPTDQHQHTEPQKRKTANQNKQNKRRNAEREARTPEAEKSTNRKGSERRRSGGSGKSRGESRETEGTEGRYSNAGAPAPTEEKVQRRKEGKWRESGGKGGDSGSGRGAEQGKEGRSGAERGGERNGHVMHGLVPFRRGANNSAIQERQSEKFVTEEKSGVLSGPVSSRRTTPGRSGRQRPAQLSKRKLDSWLTRQALRRASSQSSGKRSLGRPTPDVNRLENE